MKHSRIAIIGAGAVGSTTAYAIMFKNLITEIILVDIDKVRCYGEILDLSDVLPFSGASTIKSGGPKDVRDAQIIIIAAGKRQKYGQTREELLETNKEVVSNIIQNLKPINPNAIIIMVSNPVDVMTYCAQEMSGLPRNQVFGSGTFLDTQRLCGLLSKKLHVAEQSIDAFILGEHGDSQFPAWSSAYVAGIPLLDFPQINQKELDTIAHEVCNRAYEIIKCKGATYYGIAACIASICESIIFNQRRIIPVSCYQEQFQVSLSMPAVLGQKGIEQILPIPFNKKEKELLSKSVQKLKKLIG